MKAFPPWRLPNGIKSASDLSLESAAESAERWSWGCGGLVVIGVFAECALAVLNFPIGSFWGHWGSALADFAVGFGVAGEILFARMESIRNGELLGRTRDRLSDAIERAAEIERLTARRHVSPEQASRLLSAVKLLADKIDLLIEHQRDDSEALIYAREWDAAFVRAGVSKIRFSSNAYLSGNVFGIHVVADGLDVDAGLITSAFSDPLFPVVHFGRNDLSTHLPRGQTPPNLYVFVASKPPPEWGLPKPMPI